MRTGRIESPRPVFADCLVLVARGELLRNWSVAISVTICEVSENTPPVCLCPWRENPYQLVSWWDMENFSGQDLHAAISILERIRFTWAIPDEGNSGIRRDQVMATPDQRDQLETDLRTVERLIRNSGLPTSGEALMEFRSELAGYKLAAFSKLSAKDIQSRLEEIQRTMRREMKAVTFLYIPAEKAKLWTEPLADWDRVIARWPDVKGDIDESARCFALDRMMPGTPLKVSDPRIHRLRDSSLLSNRLV